MKKYTLDYTAIIPLARSRSLSQGMYDGEDLYSPAPRACSFTLIQIGLCAERLYFTSYALD